MMHKQAQDSDTIGPMVTLYDTCTEGGCVSLLQPDDSLLASAAQVTYMARCLCPLPKNIWTAAVHHNSLELSPQHQLQMAPWGAAQGHARSTTEGTCSAIGSGRLGNRAVQNLPGFNEPIHGEGLGHHTNAGGTPLAQAARECHAPGSE